MLTAGKVQHMFKDENKIQWKEHVAAVADMGLIVGYSDGYFRPEGTLTQGAYCKMLYLLAAGNGYWSQLLYFRPTCNWSDLQDAVFGRYIGFFGQLIDKNPDIAGDWGRRLRAGNFNAALSIRKNDALLWIHFVSKVCYRLSSDQVLLSLSDNEKENDATSEWVSNLIFIYCTEIVKELKQASGEDRHVLFELWSKCGENIDHVLGPNPEILRVFEKCSPIEYEMLTYAENYIAPFYSVQIPIQLVFFQECKILVVLYRKVPALRPEDLEPVVVGRPGQQEGRDLQHQVIAVRHDREGQHRQRLGGPVRLAEEQDEDLCLLKVHQQQYHLSFVIHRPAQILPRFRADRLIDRSLRAADQDKPVSSDGMAAAEKFLRLV